ncbi:SET and MYND domain-containing protein 4 [Microplitis demolitor]|uniref:SET and MYND domain-containing protein 4 n=1 Tax=Microplitis demolitor TaxID=69319 RepID=UPI0006D4F9D5|nr:SET and MYND domain-containing protein 4 [Microplitis demolitor]
MTIGKFFNDVYKVKDDETFIKQFNDYSKSGNRHKMIEMIMQLQQVSGLKITPMFTGKNNEKARQLFDYINFLEKETAKETVAGKINLLTQALFAVESNNLLPLGIQIVLSRARHAFSVGLYQKCCKDCDYAIQLLDNIKISCEDELDNYKKISSVLKSQAKKLISKNSNEFNNNNNNNLLVIIEIDGKRNKKLLSCSEAVTFSHNSVRGRHLVAARNIKAGSVVIIDKPFAFSTDKQALGTNCLHCHVSFSLEDKIKIPCANCQTVSFCSEKCRREAWDSYHKYECMIFNIFIENFDSNRQRSHLLLAYRATVIKAINKELNTLDKEFMDYHREKNEDRNEFIRSDINVYDPLDYKTVYLLETHCKKSDCQLNLARAIKAVYLAKCLEFIFEEFGIKSLGVEEIKILAVGIMRHMQAIDCNAYEIVENIRDEETKTWEPINIGGAIYTTVSLVNHSCYPNVVRHSYPGGKVAVRALRFIEKGSEILDCYGPHFISDKLLSRQKYLSDKYYFICTCDACKNDWKLPMGETIFRCLCGSKIDHKQSRCTRVSCSRKADIKKSNDQLIKSTKKRVSAITKMYDGNYVQALPLLLEHSGFLDKNLMPPNIEAVKTQQSIIQCFNSMANVSKNF